MKPRWSTQLPKITGGKQLCCLYVGWFYLLHGSNAKAYFRRVIKFGNQNNKPSITVTRFSQSENTCVLREPISFGGEGTSSCCWGLSSLPFPTFHQSNEPSNVLKFPIGCVTARGPAQRLLSLVRGTISHFPEFLWGAVDTVFSLESTQTQNRL